MASIPEILLRTLDDLLGKDLLRFQWYLQHTQLPQFPPIPKSCLESACPERVVDRMCESYGETGALEVMVLTLKKMNQNQLAEQLRKTVKQFSKEKAVALKTTVRERLKTTLRIKHDLIHEGPFHNLCIYLKEIYTDLYIMKGGTGGVCNEHEVRQIQESSRVFTTAKMVIKSRDIFNPRPEERTAIRKVLTLGIAGVGKTVSVKKFVLDWAEGNANLDIDYVFPLTFRSLNLLDGKYSLMQLLHHLFADVKNMDVLPFDESKVLFILDGLDESRLPLNFVKNEVVNDVQQQTSLDALITNLIAGELIPAALVWVTSRPAAVSRVPLEYFNQITEIQGFSDKQKEEYFRKRISDPEEANKIIAHMKTSKSLHIMCHIPVFCSIFATVLQKMLNQQDDQEIPSTLTGMYIHFLIFQTMQTERKYHKTDNIVLKLGRLAFLQLQKGNVIFYEEDLKVCGIDVQEASVYSGVCTQIFKLNFEMQEKCFSFVHLSIQEFFAAVYVFYAHRNNKRNPVLERVSAKFKWIVQHTMLDLHKSVVNEALHSKTGHLDLFLRFLLGLSIKSNEKQVRQLLPEIKPYDVNVDETINHLKEKIRANISPERSINLFYCLSELRDNSLVEEVQSYVRLGRLSSEELSPTHWSALVFLLMTSEDTQNLFDLKKYTQTDEGLTRLLPVVGYSNHALLDRCGLTEASCEGIASIIASTSSYLRDLDLSDNDLGDSGVKMLSDGLKNPQCKLEILRLSGCLITVEGCSSLAAALVSNPSHLKELDLSYNNPGEYGVQLLSARWTDSNCKLEKLNLDDCGPMRIVAGPRKYARELTLDPNTAHKHLCLSEGDRQVVWVEEELQYPDHPARFQFEEQVLCREPLSQRSYWEVCWNGEGVHIGAAYGQIARGGQGKDCWLGHRSDSWKLYCTHDSYTAWHNKKSVYVPSPCTARIGVFLDWEAGTLSFYNVSEDTQTLTPLHTFQSTFMEPLYPGLRVLRSSARLHAV